MPGHTWWRVERHCPAHPPAAVAAAISTAVAKATGLRRPKEHANSIYAIEPESAEGAALDLRAHLCLDRTRGW